MGKLITNKLITKNLKLKNTIYALSLFAICCLLFAVCCPPVSAQLNSIGIASYLSITNGKIEDGDIIVSAAKGYSLSNADYETNIIGVVNTNPAISIKSSDQKKGFPVITSGTSSTKVTDEGGSIKKGDLITTSSLPGVGMKATDNGEVLGISLADVTFSKKGEVKFVTVFIEPHFAQTASIANQLLNVFKIGKTAAYEAPSKTLQYILAATIAIASFGCGFLIFAKAVNTGLEALGRNPLAGRMIQLSIIFNLLLIAVVVIAGIALAYLVLRL